MTIIHRITLENFTAYYTNDDEYDGGNSNGVIVSGTLPDPQNAVAVIHDSDLSCL